MTVRVGYKLIGILAYIFLTAQVFGQTGQLEQPLPDSLDEQVKLLVGIDLPRASSCQRKPQGLAYQAAWALISAGEDAVPALERAMSSKDAIQRLNVAFVLFRIGTPATLPLLRSYLIFFSTKTKASEFQRPTCLVTWV